MAEPRENPGLMALEAYRKQRDVTDDQIQAVKDFAKDARMMLGKGTSVGTQVQGDVEGALLSAESNRELAMATTVASETIDASLRLANHRIELAAATLESAITRSEQAVSALDKRLGELNTQLFESSRAADAASTRIGKLYALRWEQYAVNDGTFELVDSPASVKGTMA